MLETRYQNGKVIFVSVQPSCDSASSERQHAEALNAALAIFRERSKERGDLWARFDEHDSFHHARSKLARIGVHLQQGSYKNDDELRDRLIDEIDDLVNYAVFLRRHVTGKKPKLLPADL